MHRPGGQRFVAYLVGRNHRLHADRAEQARLLAEQTALASERQAQAAPLAECGRRQPRYGRIPPSPDVHALADRR
ncbi:hypothetical protein NE236_27245 [Actinoallomurus purpureus]|uniref:hypothetical protein n=1 Tax=Actinoallomurus purpureus TaxID=478114 RepID=UPI002091E8AB|nr:hypothetical protein [Actinoallomurus purpureus]MCO6008675.1 hypothetical protein [Actinoallomurus purpureus]